MFDWNPMYNYLVQQWNCMDHSLPFKQQFQDSNVTISEYINKDDHLILVKYLITCDEIYNQNSMYREARSLTIDLNTQEIVLCPYRKFFNINEIEETSLQNVQKLIDSADKVEITNKLDGSMQSYRYYHDHIVSSGSSALDENISFQLKEGRQLFTNNYYQLCKDYKDYTFIFEAILNSDPHVVNYNQESLTLLGARNVYNGQIFTYEQISILGKQYNIPYVQIENINLEQALQQTTIYKSNEKEGWVIAIYHSNNVDMFKLKCDDYLSIHKLLSALSSANAIIKALADHTYDDLLSKVPVQYKPRVEKIANKIKTFMRVKIEIIDYYFSLVQDINDMKDFAIKVQESIPEQYHKYMFMMKKNKSFNILKPNSYVKEQEINDFLAKI